ncbi:MAG: hypothetical protein ACHQVS_02395 [Candidatus Babeliales bacterium]
MMIRAQLLPHGQRLSRNATALVTLSAVLLTIPLYFPHSLCWLVFIAYVPLFYAALMHRLTFWHGFWWGLLCWSGQLYALFWMVYEHGYGAFRMLVPLMLVIYCALYSAVVFYGAAHLSRGKSREVGAGIWVFCVCFYYLSMRYASLWIIGLSTGYPLALPVLVLAEYPHCLGALPYLTSAGLLVCLLVSAMGVAYYCLSKQQMALVLSVAGLLPFGIGWVVPSTHIPEPPLVRICATVIPPVPYGAMHPRDRAQDINACIMQVCADKPETQIIILPESSYPFELNTHENVIDLWSINALDKGQQLVLGSYYKEKGNLYNGIYGIKECRVIFNYVKNCRMPFTEYVPFPWSLLTCTRTLFLKNKCGFSAKESPYVIPLTPDFLVCPALCSEFFFDAYARNLPYPVLALVNDSWFSCTYIKRLMYLFARYTACEQSQDVIYSSYTYGAYIDKLGNEW